MATKKTFRTHFLEIFQQFQSTMPIYAQLKEELTYDMNIYKDEVTFEYNKLEVSSKGKGDIKHFSSH